MKRKYLALLLSIAMAGGAFTGCGDSDDDDTQSGATKASSTAESEDTTELSTEKGEKASGISVRTTLADTSEPETEVSSEAETGAETGAKPPLEITLDLTDMIGMHPGEIAQLFGGDFELETDAGPGTFRMYNHDVLPDVDFYFEDHSWDSLFDGSDIDYSALKDNVLSSRQSINKINRYAGVQDEFRIGMSYNDCANIIGAFPAMAGDNGDTVVGCPCSLTYHYLHEYNRDCVVALHFELAGEADRALNEGRLIYPGTNDVSPIDMSRFDPELQVISVIYAPQITSNMTAAATSTLPDITSNGKKYSYSAGNAVDGRLDTCWCEGAADTGIDQKLTVRNSDLKKCKFITVYGGLMTGKDSFYKNCRPAVLEIEPEGVIEMGYIMLTDYNTRYRRAVPVGYIQDDAYDFIIKEADSSKSEYSDTCISEIIFNG